jgi:hypothetical protein
MIKKTEAGKEFFAAQLSQPYKDNAAIIIIADNFSVGMPKVSNLGGGETMLALFNGV